MKSTLPAVITENDSLLTQINYSDLEQLIILFERTVQLNRQLNISEGFQYVPYLQNFEELLKQDSNMIGQLKKKKKRLYLVSLWSTRKVADL